MDMLMGDQIAAARLRDWRKLAQGLHTRYLINDFGTGARLVVAVGVAGDAFGHHPTVSIGKGYVDLKLVTADAIYREDDGTEHVVEWVTQLDIDLARRISDIAAEHGVEADPAAVSHIELGLDTARSATIAPVWAAEEAERRIAAVVAAGGEVVDDTNAPGLTVFGDQDGNRGIVCSDRFANTAT